MLVALILGGSSLSECGHGFLEIVGAKERRVPERHLVQSSFEVVVVVVAKKPSHSKRHEGRI